jgi:hypothetical protein
LQSVHIKPIIQYRPGYLLFAHKNVNQNKTNTSKILKLDFTDETEEEKLFAPRYSFGLSEFDMILLRIYVYMVVTIYCLTMIFENTKK